MTTPGALPVGNTGHILDTVVVDQGLGIAHREAVALGDPTQGGAFAAVLSAPPAPGSYGVVARALLEPWHHDLSGRLRVGQLTTLFDGKALNADDAFKWHTAGTGSLTFTGNRPDMAVDSGEYLVRQSRRFMPYFSGKPQLVETTTFDFHNQAGVVKRTGYFSSNAVAPYASTFDGFYLEADGSAHRLVCWRAGTKTHDIPLVDWDAAELLAGYDWSTFTVMQFDFLWLGGAGLRFWMVLDGVFRLIHTIDDHAGAQSGLIFQSPAQPMRHEIRSTGGAGSFTPQCCQVGSEGPGPEEGEAIATTPMTAVATNSVGTIYALKGVRKAAAYRDTHVTIDSFSVGIATVAADAGTMMLVLNPTLSADLTWTALGRIEEGSAASGQTLTAGTGRVLTSRQIVSASEAADFARNALRVLSGALDNTMDRVILAYMPQTTTQSVAGAINLTEY